MSSPNRTMPAPAINEVEELAILVLAAFDYYGKDGNYSKARLEAMGHAGWLFCKAEAAYLGIEPAFHDIINRAKEYEKGL